MLQSRSTRDHTTSSEGFCSLAESARARHAEASVHERHHDADPAEKFLFSSPARDYTMSSHERRNGIESTRGGRRTPASIDEARHGERVRPIRQDDTFPSRARSSRSRSPAKRSRSPGKAPPIPRSTTADSDLAERKHNPRPAVIDVDIARQYGSVSKKAIVVDGFPQHQSKQGAIVHPNTPPTPLCRVPKLMSPSMSESEEDEGSSYYSEEDFGQAHPSYVSPLRVRKGVDSDNNDNNNNTVLRSHSTWGRSPSPERSPERYPHSPQRLVVLLFLLYPLAVVLVSSVLVRIY